MPKLPKIGMRIVKSALAVFVCLLIDRLRGGMPFYAAIAAILCMQPDVANSLKTAANRVIGTLVGGLAGRRLGELFQQRAELVGGLVLIGIGVKILIEHLCGG